MATAADLLARAEARARRTVERERARMLAAMAASEEGLSATARRNAERGLRDALEAMDGDPVSLEATAERLRTILRESNPRAAATVRAAALESARAGRDAASGAAPSGVRPRLTSDAHLAEALRARFDTPRTLPPAMRIPGEVVRVPALSSDLWGARAGLAEAAASRVHGALDAWWNTERATRELHRTLGTPTALPRWAEEVRAAAMNPLADTRELRSVVRSHLPYVASLTSSPAGLRGASTRFLAACREGVVSDVRRATEEFLERRALYFARRIARTESARAFSEAYIRDTRDTDWTKGYRWVLSASHPRLDVCDVYAEQNLHGLGPGGYPKEEPPQLPAHPHCLCHLEQILDDRPFARRLHEESGGEEGSAVPETWRDERGRTPSSAAFVASMTPARRLELLGPGRAAVFARSPEAVVTRTGALRSLGAAAELAEREARARRRRR